MNELKEHHDIRYFKTGGKYKYVLDRHYGIVLPQVRLNTAVLIPDYVLLNEQCKLVIRRGYAWDGPSGPTIDTPNFMRGSLVHDVLYQLMREGQLDVEWRETADNVLHDICRQDGMGAFRAWYVWASVRMFGASHARPR